MKIIDISGSIYDNMWSYGERLKITESNFDFHGKVIYHKTITNLDTAIGTFIETSAIWYGYEDSITTSQIPLEKIFYVDSYVLQVPYEKFNIVDNQPCITLKDIKSAEQGEIPEDSAILVATGYGKNWDKEDFLFKSPFFKKEAIYISK